MSLEKTLPLTCAASRRLWFNLRALACEELFRLSIRVRPAGYIPSYDEAFALAYRLSQQSRREEEK